jgi:hypothetical protein
MARYVGRFCNREEEFLEKFDLAYAALRVVPEWHPNEHCNEQSRRNTEQLRKDGNLSALVFESATVYHDEDTRMVDSVAVRLGSSMRKVTVEIRRDGNYDSAKIVSDSNPPPAVGNTPTSPQNS